MKRVFQLLVLTAALIPTISLACDVPETTATCGGCGNGRTRTVIVSFTTVGTCQYQPQFSYGNCGSCAV